MGKEYVHICNEQTTCNEIVSLFSIRRQDVENCSRILNGWTNSSTTEFNTARFEERIQSDRRVKSRQSWD
ncbi:hypothetical protein TNCV_1508021 [Trichonephila clavipes]|nr:hypothetical protein TNCV_1508021 [Trichonephila clavipes]